MHFSYKNGPDYVFAFSCLSKSAIIGSGINFREVIRMKKLHYGWIVCISAMLLIFVTMGSVSNGFSVYLPYIMEKNGFTYSQTSTLVTLRCLFAFVSMLFIGAYYRKFSIRTGAAIAVLTAALVFLIYGFSSSYFMFCVGSSLSGFSYGTGSMIPISILLNRWFSTNKALAISIASAGSGLGPIVLSPLVTLLVETYSLRFAFFAETVGILVLALIIILLMRNDPSDMGLQPLGIEKNNIKDKIPSADALKEEKEKTPESIDSEDHYMPSRKVWLLICSVCLFMGAVSNPGFSHLSVHFKTEGFSAVNVATILTIAGIMLVGAKLVFGWVTDRTGGLKSGILFLGILLAGHILCCMAFTGSVPLAYLSSFTLGLGYPVCTIGISIWAGDMSSPSGYPTVVRRMQVTYAGGSFVFAIVPGLLADTFGNYIPAYMVFSALLVVSIVLLPIAYRTSKKERTVI